MNYNDYGYNNYRVRRPSNAPVVVTFVVLFIIGAVVGLAAYYSMMSRIGEYDSRIAGYESQLQEYKSALGELRAAFDDLNLALLGLSGNLSDGLIDVGELRDSLERVSSSPVFADTNNSRSINIANTAARVSPSVVGVRAHVPAQNLNNFWRTARAMSSEGSGIIISADGYVVTNFHVVELAVHHASAVLSVILSDGTEHIAEYVGGDELNDLAVLRINASNLPYAILGSSDEAQVGDFVIAIGNPLGMYLSGSVTFGIISGLNRTIQAANVAENLIQTDAAINPGNSGGALLNLNGEVIGINTIKVARSGGGVNVEGIGFAIPMDFARPLIDSIIAHGYVRGRPAIGFYGSSISSSIATIYRVPRGVLIQELDANGGAAAVGIRVGDIITQVDGVNILSMNDVGNIIRQHRVGDSVRVTLWRGGSLYEAHITLTEQ